MARAALPGELPRRPHPDLLPRPGESPGSQLDSRGQGQEPPRGHRAGNDLSRRLRGPGARRAPADRYRLRSLESRRRISRYSQISVTITPKAPYHSMKRGAPAAAPAWMKLKSSARLKAATITTATLNRMPTGPLL